MDQSTSWQCSYIQHTKVVHYYWQLGSGLRSRILKDGDGGDDDDGGGGGDDDGGDDDDDDVINNTETLNDILDLLHP